MHPDPRLTRIALAAAGLHAALALFFWLGLGVTIVHDFGPDPWGWFSQNLPTDLLRERPLQSLWHLHSQPPAWNALGALLLALFGSAQLHVLQLLHIALGATVTALCASMAGGITGTRAWAVVVGLAVGLHPALFLFEAYALYTVLSVFLLTGAAWLVGRIGPGSRGAVLGFVAVLTALVLTRSVYHLGFLAAGVALARLLAGRLDRALWLAVVLVVALPTGWYAKNRVQFGFFGASSWYGAGLWRVALFRQDEPRVQQMYRDGAFAPVVRVAPFSPPSVYRPLGYDRVSDVPALDRDDHNNVNVPDISRDYQRSALALIRETPGRYLANVLVAYGNFVQPSSAFPHLAENRARIQPLSTVEHLLLARPLVAAVERWRGGERFYGSAYYLLMPAILLGYLALLVRGSIRSNVGEDPVSFFLAVAVAYTLVVSCTMELGENGRFKFLVEPLFLVLAAGVVHRGWRAVRRSREAQGPGGPPRAPDVELEPAGPP